MIGVSGERGSTLPLVVGFLAIGLLAVAAGVAAGDAFVQQRELQAICDGAAAAAAAEAVQLDRGTGMGADRYARFASVQDAVERYLARDPGRSGVHITAALASAQRAVALTCVRTAPVTWGRLVGHPDLRHVAHAWARGALS